MLQPVCLGGTLLRSALTFSTVSKVDHFLEHEAKGEFPVYSAIC